MKIPIRVATSAINGRIFAGRLNKSGISFFGDRFDVTSDCIKAIIEHIGIDNEITVNVEGKPAYDIRVSTHKEESND